MLDRERVERAGRIVAPIEQTHFVRGGGHRKDKALRSDQRSYRENTIQVMRRLDEKNAEEKCLICS